MVLWSLKAGPGSFSCHPYAEGLDKMLMHYPPDSKLEESDGGGASFSGSTALPATVLSADQKVTCILLEGRDLPLLVPITALSFHP